MAQLSTARNKKTTLTHLFRPAPLIISHSTAPKAAGNSSTTNLRALQTVQLRLGRLVRSRPSSAFYCLKQNLTHTHLVRRTTLLSFGSALPTTAASSSGIRLRTVQTEPIRSKRSLRSHLSPALHCQKQSPTPTHLVRPAPLTISPSTVSTAADSSSAIYLRKVQTKRIWSDKSPR